MRELMEMWKMRFEDVLTYLHFRSPVAALQAAKEKAGILERKNQRITLEKDEAKAKQRATEQQLQSEMAARQRAEETARMLESSLADLQKLTQGATAEREQRLMRINDAESTAMRAIEAQAAQGQRVASMEE